MKFRPQPRRSNSIIPPGRQIPRLSCLLLALAPACFAQTDADDLAFFEKHIRPALAEHCYECHSAESKKLKGGLRLDHRGGWEKGGESGPAIVRGKPAESRLLEAIGYRNPDLEMPPDGKLPAEVVARFEEWIQRGAPDPRDEARPALASKPERVIDLEEGRKFWSFLPIANPEPPPIDKDSWAHDPIDHFILAKLSRSDLSPSPSAGPYTILRRLHNDITGLPPTLAEIEHFVSRFETNPRAAIEEKTDQLLADPAFGERWGRHWLDLARYSDSTGGGRAIPLPDAWRFRDYVIEAFNEDRPLDQLIREHIAGDLLPHSDRDERLRNLIATGFLVLGPHNYENQDKELLDLEIVDEQLDTIGRSFLGMTIGCARCHDHKFDPIPTRDYYALAGIFTSTHSVKHANVSAWHKEEVPRTPEEEKVHQETTKEIAALEAQLKDLKKGLALRQPGKPASPTIVALEDLPGLVIDDTEAELTGKWVKSSSVPNYVGAGYLHDVHEKKGTKSALFRLKIAKAGKYEVRVSYSPSTNRPENTPVTVGHAQGESKFTINQKKPAKHGKLFHSLGVFEFQKGEGSFVRFDTDGTSGAVIVDAVQLLSTAKPPESPKTKSAPTEDEKQTAREIAALREDIRHLEPKLKKLKAKAPKPHTVMAVKDADKPIDDKVRVRGMPRNIGEAVPRGFLQVAQRPGKPMPVIANGSGRLELAQWVASPDNPLTARVLANRIWHHLFGHGLVRTPDNFGVTGEPPSHPQLLDHLAQRLIKENWSTKKLVRAIVLSRTYQLAAAPSTRAVAKDPNNLLLSHAHRRAIDVETIRDTMLVLSGQLDRASGGPSLSKNFRTEFGFKFTTRRRSVYVPVFRNTLYDLFATFDFANPNFTVGRRSDSTTPTQALFLFNSPFVHQQAKAAAGELLKLEAADDAVRIRLAFLRTLSRPPSSEELAMSARYLKKSGPGNEAWISLHRALFSTVDFRYLP